MNKEFELVEDSDLDDTGNATQWIWECPTCHAIFGSKAIHNRTIFPWFGHHPADGNCRILTDETTVKIRNRANKCDCPVGIVRIKSRQQLINAINTHR